MKGGAAEVHAITVTRALPDQSGEQEQADAVQDY
jgi:hypothetical protein